MAADKSVIWAEKYRPKTLEDYIFNDSTHKNAFAQMAEKRTIPHLLLSGTQGSGKTTIAEILINLLDIDSTDLLVINGSDETGVDAMREKIKGFISTYSMSGIKIVQLEEADYLSKNAQAVLRKYMEDFNDEAKFILTCNYVNKILPAIKSRTQEYKFTAADNDEIALFAAKILLAEDIKFDIDLLDKYISSGYPDIRKIINLLQQNSINGHLQPPLSSSNSSDYRFELLDHMTNDNWRQARELCCVNVAQEEWEDLYRFLYDNLHKSKKFSTPSKCDSGITIIADFLNKNSSIADQEINAAAMFIALSNIK